MVVVERVCSAGHRLLTTAWEKADWLEINNALRRDLACVVCTSRVVAFDYRVSDDWAKRWTPGNISFVPPSGIRRIVTLSDGTRVDVTTQDDLIIK